MSDKGFTDYSSDFGRALWNLFDLAAVHHFIMIPDPIK